MACQACGAASSARQQYCAICGLDKSAGSGKRWNRAPEACCYADSAQRIRPDEAIMGFTRGRLVGSIAGRLTIDPAAILAPWADIAITERRVIIARVTTSSGRSTGDPHLTLEEPEIGDVSSTETAGPDSRRLLIQLREGGSVVLRTVGRFGRLADHLAAGWTGMRRSAAVAPAAASRCTACGRERERPTAHCPYCGTRQEPLNV